MKEDDNIGKQKDLTGQVFGHLTALKQLESNKSNSRWWLCECDCENKTQIEIDSHRLTSGIKTHCGCRRTYKWRKDVVFPEEYVGKTKCCSKCGEEKEYKEFYFKDYINKDGEKTYYFNSQCVQCDTNDALIWQVENREEWLKHNNKMNRKPSKMAQRRKITQQRRENGYYEKYYAENPEKAKEQSENHRIHDITDKEWEECLKVFKYLCAYCGISQAEAKNKFKQKLHKDHVEHEGYNDLRNGVPACKNCNSYKWQFIMEEWFRQQPFFSEEKLNFIKWWCEVGYRDYIQDRPPYRVTRIRVYDENNKYTMQFELWSVDEKRNIVDCIYVGKNKKEIDNYIKENYK